MNELKLETLANKYLVLFCNEYNKLNGRVYDKNCKYINKNKKSDESWSDASTHYLNIYSLCKNKINGFKHVVNYVNNSFVSPK